MGIFGWSLPPGVSMNDIDPSEGPCQVCGHSVDDCICPECPHCGEHGNPYCYDGHGLVRTQAQIDGYNATIAHERANDVGPEPEPEEDEEVVIDTPEETETIITRKDGKS